MDVKITFSSTRRPSALAFLQETQEGFFVFLHKRLILSV